MAITILQQPTPYWPICNDVEWTFSSTNTGQDNFSFIIELYLNGFIHSTHEIYPENGSTGKFGISTIGRAVSISNVPEQSVLSAELNVDNTWSLLVYEKYGTPPVTDLGSSTATSSFNFLNASLRYNEIYPTWSPEVYDIENVRGEYFLTEYPRNRKELIAYNESKFLSIINSAANNCTVEIKLYDITNTLITSTTYAANGLVTPMLSVGPSRLVASTPLNAGDFTNCYYYTVRIYQTAATSKTSEAYKLYYDQECTRYTPQRLLFLNRFGAWDSFTFKLLSEESTEIQSNNYSRSTGTWSAGVYSHQLSTGQKMTMSKFMTDRLIVNTEWIHEDVQNWLVRELYESPRVYLNVDYNIIYIEPVNVTNANYILKQRRKAGLIQELVQIDRTYTKISQLG